MSQKTLAAATHSRPALRMHATPLTPQFARSGSMIAHRSPPRGLSERTHARQRCVEVVCKAPGTRECCRKREPITPGTRMTGPQASGDLSHALCGDAESEGRHSCKMRPIQSAGAVLRILSPCPHRPQLRRGEREDGKGKTGEAGGDSSKECAEPDNKRDGESVMERGRAGEGWKEQERESLSERNQ
eukprot:scaffold159168_cov35-Tisochrysis_lutea.AAC.1